MQVMLPYNVAVLAIATIFYFWRDMYVPKCRQKHVAKERVAKLLWAAAAHEGRRLPDLPDLSEKLELPEIPDAAFKLFRDVECRACRGSHTFHVSGEAERPAGSTYEFTCPSSGKSAWIWWLEKPEAAEEVPADSVNLKWVPG